jgi:hypothetical protein
MAKVAISLVEKRLIERKYVLGITGWLSRGVDAISHVHYCEIAQINTVVVSGYKPDE